VPFDVLSYVGDQLDRGVVMHKLTGLFVKVDLSSCMVARQSRA
jgi:hypothetical protein